MFIFYKFGDALAFSLNTEFFSALGFDKTTIAVSFKSNALIFTIIGVVVGGSDGEVGGRDPQRRNASASILPQALVYFVILAIILDVVVVPSLKSPSGRRHESSSDVSKG